MKNLSVSFQNIEELKLFINQNSIKNDIHLLVQIFCAEVDREFILELQNFFNTFFPSCSLIGTTSDGVIENSEIYVNTKNVATFSQFENTRLTTHFIDHRSTKDGSYKAGINLASALKAQDVKALIVFADGIETNGEELVKGIETVLPDVVLAGGLAGDNGKLFETLIFDRASVSSSGAVGVALANKDLFVSTNYSFDWIPIGKKMKVTKAVKNRVYQLDGQPIVDVYAKYMGRELAKKLPQVGIEFPLIFEKDGLTIGRAVLAKHNDGSLTFAGNIDEYTVVRFGVGDIGSILNHSNYAIHSMMEQFPCKADGVFVYSCMARRRFLDSSEKRELENIAQLGPTSGFFTYGEFFHFQEKNQLLNETMTFIMLSEKCQYSANYKMEDIHQKETLLTTQHVLANLANTVSNELAELNESLEQRVKESTEYIFKQAYYNELTGLPNRISFINDLEEHLGELLILINIDNFSAINDFYGYKVGDQVLKQLSETLSEYSERYGFKVYKLPADEFAIILNIKNKQVEIEKHLRAILKLIEEKDYLFHGQNIHIGVTMGASIINSQRTGMVNADMSLKLAKSKRKSFMIFDKDLKLAQKYEQNMQIANKIKQALQTGNIIPFFQPIVDPYTLETIKYEALVRLKDEKGEVLSPYLFLDISQKIRLYENITMIMVEKTFKYFSHNRFDFTLNFSFSDIVSEKIRKFLCDKIQEYGVGAQLTIELLETQEFENSNAVHDFVEKISKYGVKIAIDDFGSGYANFEYVTNIQADFIKIDGSLIKNIDTDKNARIITETIIGFAKKMDKKVIAEFVHSKEVFDTVKELGVDYVQGYYLGEPKEFI